MNKEEEPVISYIRKSDMRKAGVTSREVQEAMNDWSIHHGLSADAWIQAYGGDNTGWCKKGLSGTHLTYYITIGNRDLFMLGHRLGKAVARSCAGDCKWSRAI